jgi:hypothetical protein
MEAIYIKSSLFTAVRFLENPVNDEITALLHLTRQTGHYTLLHFIWDGFNTLPNSMF